MKNRVVVNALTSIAGFVIGAAIFVAIIIAPFFLIRWGVYAAVTITPFLNSITSVVFLICVLIFVPMSFYKKLRSISAIGIGLSSFLFGLSVWLAGLLISYSYFGLIWMFIGLCFAGIGVIPMALFALVIHGNWDSAGIILLEAVVAIAAFTYSAYLSEANGS